MPFPFRKWSSFNFLSFIDLKLTHSETHKELTRYLTWCENRSQISFTAIKSVTKK